MPAGSISRVNINELPLEGYALTVLEQAGHGVMEPLENAMPRKFLVYEVLVVSVRVLNVTE
jgi:hypothetical protein